MSVSTDAMLDDMVLQTERLLPSLRRYALVLTRDPIVADDLVQDCLERAVVCWHQRRDKQDARAWMFAIMHNLAVSLMRRNLRRGHHLGLDQATRQIPSHRAGQEDGLNVNSLFAVVDRLPEAQRAVLLLVGLDGLSYSEVAQILSIPQGTVMSRLSRAREKIRQTLQLQGD